jgi:hypothetical protein
MDWVMNFIYFFAIAIVVFYTYSAIAKPWVVGEGRFEVVVSDRIYSTVFPYNISYKKYLLQKELADLSMKFDRTDSRRKKSELDHKISALKGVEKHLFSYYEKYGRYFGLEYGISDRKSIGFELNYYEMGGFERSFNKFIFSPNINFALLSGKDAVISLHSKLQSIFFNKRINNLLELGLSLGRSKIKKKKKIFNYCDFFLSTNQSYNFNLGMGIESKNGYMGIISTSYFKDMKSYKDINSDKLRTELILAKKLNNLDSQVYSISIFISYFTEYSSYSNINISNGIEVGFYYK